MMTLIEPRYGPTPTSGHGRRIPIWILLAIIVVRGPAAANPVPDPVAREMNERPGRWLAHPTLDEERRLLEQFALHGISRGLLSPATIRLLEREFDRFAPILVEAQRPPRCLHEDLQRWYRERADPAQSGAMKGALRQWLLEKVTEVPICGGSRMAGPPEAVAREIQWARLGAAEELGKWHDKQALPILRAMLRELPANPILVLAIRRIADPTRADVLVVERNRRIALRRPLADLDSMVVTSWDGLADQRFWWRADAAGASRIWRALAKGRVGDRFPRHRIPNEASFRPERLQLYYRDGLSAKFERSGSRWSYSDNGSPRGRLEFVNDDLVAAVMDELVRVEIAPGSPRFVGESVTLWIRPGELEVRGRYEFEGAPPDGWVPLRYPIASGEGLGQPRIDSVELYDSRSDMRVLPSTYEQRGAVCRIALTPGNVQAYALEVRYRQPLAGRSATYLITTAREWGRPLHRAWFQVIMERSLGEPRFQFPFREVAEGSGSRRFLFEASPFRPERDLVVSW